MGKKLSFWDPGAYQGPDSTTSPNAAPAIRTAIPESGVGPLIGSGQAGKVIVSHIGTNPVTGKKMIAGELAVDLERNLLRVRRLGFDSLLQPLPRPLKLGTRDDLAALTAFESAFVATKHRPSQSGLTVPYRPTTVCATG